MINLNHVEILLSVLRSKYPAWIRGPELIAAIAPGRDTRYLRDLTRYARQQGEKIISDPNLGYKLTRDDKELKQYQEKRKGALFGEMKTYSLQMKNNLEQLKMEI